MSQAVRKFLHLLDEAAHNENITKAWENLTPAERAEADELAQTTDTMEMEVPVLAFNDEESMI